MRLSAYKESINEARILPVRISKLSSYFQSGYSPRLAAIQHILDMARADSCLSSGKFAELYTYIYGGSS